MEAFCELAPKGEKIFTAADVPYGVPLVMSGVYKLEGSKYDSFAMHAEMAVIAPKIESKKVTFLPQFKERTNIEAAYRELMKKVAIQKKDTKLEVKETPMSEITRQSFDFYLPKRLCEVCNKPESLEEVNSKRLLGYFVGKRGVSVCMVLVPLEEGVVRIAKRKYNAVTTPVITLHEDEEEQTNLKKQRKGEEIDCDEDGESDID